MLFLSVKSYLYVMAILKSHQNNRFLRPLHFCLFYGLLKATYFTVRKVVWMTYMLNNMTTVILILNVILAFTIVFLERKATAQTRAWLLVLIFVPILGFLLYFFRKRFVKRKNI